MTATLVLGARNLRIAARQVDGVIAAVLLPVLILVLFVYLFGGAIATGVDYVTYVVPGVLLICAGFAASTTAVAITEDMSRRVVDRLRSLDVPVAAVLGGHILTGVARTAVVVGVALAVGCRPGRLGGGARTGPGVHGGRVVAGCRPGAGRPHARGGQRGDGPVHVPPVPSSAFVPVETMPGWLRAFAENQPLTPVIEAVRGFLLGQPVGDAWWQALSWWAAGTVVSLAASG